MTTSVTTAGTTMRAIIQERYGEAENVLRLGQAGLAEPQHVLGLAVAFLDDGPHRGPRGRDGGRHESPSCVYVTRKVSPVIGTKVTRRCGMSEATPPSE